MFEAMIAIGLGALALGSAILAAFLRGSKTGRDSARLEGLENGAKESSAFDQRIQNGHNAGHDVRSGRVRVDSNDPNDRANRR